MSSKHSTLLVAKLAYLETAGRKISVESFRNKGKVVRSVCLLCLIVKILVLTSLHSATIRKLYNMKLSSLYLALVAVSTGTTAFSLSVPRGSTSPSSQLSSRPTFLPKNDVQRRLGSVVSKIHLGAVSLFCWFVGVVLIN